MTDERKGEILLFLSALIWSFFPIVTVLTYQSLPSFISLGLGTLLSGFTFLTILLYRKRLHELRNPLLWKYVLGVVVFIGVLYYSFYFYGLTKTTPGNAGLIALFEIFTSYVFFHIIRKEPFSFESKVGSALMIVGAAIVLTPNISGVNTGDIFILLATFFPPFGNLLQQKAKKIASAEAALFLRSMLATPPILLIAYLFGQSLELQAIKGSLTVLIISGIFTLGLSKILWVESISRISVTKANALQSIAPLLTLFFAWIILSQPPTWWQLASLVPFFFGTLLLTDNLKFDYARRN